MLNAMKPDVDRAMLLVMDLQTKLLPHIDGAREILAAADRLVRGARLFQLPILATCQYVKGLGPLDDHVRRPLEAASVRALEKVTFSACADEAIKHRLIEIDRPQAVVTGIEAHICVQQTVLDLLSMDYAVYVCADAVGSRHELDLDIGLARMQQAGAAVTTVETVLFELCHVSGTDRFKKLLEIVK
jgi:nicotinamidase-related amidase